ncbi:MAG: cyanophycin synthetase, partial [Myxococcota bacterium]
FERVGSGPGPTVVVDYAHTPDALARTLDAARARCPGRLWVVFGCGGGRDAEKRPLMGAIAAARADRVIVTTDNPRCEDPARIAAQVVSEPETRAAVEAGRVVHVPERRSAIRSAVGCAEVGDWVLIAGKGHEVTQQLADGIVPFDDRAVAAEALQQRGEVVNGVESRSILGGGGGDRVRGLRRPEGHDLRQR